MGPPALQSTAILIGPWICLSWNLPGLTRLLTLKRKFAQTSWVFLAIMKMQCQIFGMSRWTGTQPFGGFFAAPHGHFCGIPSPWARLALLETH